MDNNVRNIASEVGQSTLVVTNTVAKGIRGRFGKLVAATQGVGVKFNELAAAGVAASAAKVHEDLVAAEAQATVEPLTFDQRFEALQIRQMEAGKIENLVERANTIRNLSVEGEKLADEMTSAAKAEEKRLAQVAKDAKKLLRKNPNAGQDLAQKMRDWAAQGQELATLVTKLPVSTTPVAVEDTTVVETSTPVS